MFPQKSYWIKGIEISLTSLVDALWRTSFSIDKIRGEFDKVSGVKFQFTFTIIFFICVQF